MDLKVLLPVFSTVFVAGGGFIAIGVWTLARQ
jgi:hypothetical protein